MGTSSEETEILTDDGPIRRFDDWFTEYRKGEPHREMSLAMHELIDAVTSIEKGGKVTLTVAVDYAGDMQLEIKTTVESKLPKPNSPSVRYFVDKTGNPTRHDPYQSALPNIGD